MTIKDITKEIQRILEIPADGIYGPQTARSVLDALGGKITSDAPRYNAPPQANRFAEVKYQSPNQSGPIWPIGIVFHHSAGSFEGSLSWCLNPASRVSYHVLIEPDGTRHQMVNLNRRAWHAGRSTFEGRSGCNAFMVGVAFSGNTYERELTQEEILSTCEFIRQNRHTFGWKLETMTDHRTVSPGRKDDLNPREFERLREAIKPIFDQ